MILYLTLKKVWFDKILNGKKKIEYRKVKPYWTKRLFNSDGKPKDFDYVYFTNGYGHKVSAMMVEYLGIGGTIKYQGKKCYRILLGDVLADNGKGKGKGKNDSL